MKFKNLKETIAKYRPDKQIFKVGDGSQSISYKIRRKKITFELSKDFDDDVNISIVVAGTGDLFNLRKEKGVEAKFAATTKF